MATTAYSQMQKRNPNTIETKIGENNGYQTLRTPVISGTRS